MKKLYFLLIFITLSTFTVGQSDYFPIEQGSVYTYAYSKALYEGQNFDVSNLSMTVEVLDETKVIDGKEYYVSQTSTSFTSPQKAYMRVAGDGSIYVIQEEGGEEAVMMSNSPAVGDTWDTYKGSGKVEGKVIALDGTVKTPITTYTGCLVLEYTENGATSRGYFYPGKGMVAVTVLIEGKEMLFVYLISEE